MNIRRIIFFLISLVLAGNSGLLRAAQTNYVFSHLKSDIGLPHQQVESMAFDHDGLLWVGTRNGLTRYDGYSFVTYYHDSADSTSIPHNFIHRIFVDSGNNVWVASDVGISRYCRDSDSFERFNIGEERLSHITEAPDGSILCAGDRLFRLRKGEREFRQVVRQTEGYIVGMAVSPDRRIFIATDKAIAYFTPEMDSETVMDASIYSDFLSGFDAIVPLHFDREGRLWIGRDGKGVMRFDLYTGEKKIFDETALSDGTVRTIAEDAGGCIWLGTEKGVTTISPVDGSTTVIRQQFGNSATLSDNAVYCIVPDAYDNIWIGTYFGGINMLIRNATQFRWTAPGRDPHTLSGKAVRRIIEPVRGTLWMATEDGGINILDLATSSIERFNRIPNLGSNVHELLFDGDGGEMWIGTFRNGLFCYNTRSGSSRHYTAFNSGLKSNAVFSLVRSDEDGGKIWIATTAGLMWRDGESDRILPVDHPVLATDFIYCLYMDRAGNLWAGTVNHGLFRIDRRTKEVKGWGKGASGENFGLNDNYVTTIYEDKAGRIFIGTNNGGLHIIDGKTLEFIPFDYNPPTFGTICGILQDSGNHIWVTTSGGLFKINPEDLSFIRFSTVDGLPENQFNFSSAIQGSDNSIYCGTVNGLVAFDPSISKRSDAATKVHLWSLVLNNNPVTPRSENSPLPAALDALEELRLDYGSSRMFSIDYGVVDPVGAPGTRYRIFIEGLDKEWRDVGSQRRFTAMELPYGKYVFKVRALSSGDDWEAAPVRQLKLMISPPYYLSSVAWLIYALLLASCCFGIYRIFLWRVREKQARKLSQMERVKTDELNREKMEFFTNISHELKTPLSLILAPLKHLATNQPLSDESRARLSTAIANTTKMVDLINELVTFNRVESGNFQLFLSKGNPLTLIETICGYFREPASEKNITINVLTQNNGEDVWFSIIYLERILSNLLSNAIKYTDDGGCIDVRAAITEGENGQVFLKLEVKDNGIGIVPEEIDNIFRKYYQTRRGYDASHSGWGIGLATVKKLVEIHKGSISVASKPGEGSSFSVLLNVDRDAFDKSCYIDTAKKEQEVIRPNFIANTLAVYSNTGSGASKEGNDERISILLVEDNPQLLRFLSDEFSREYNVFTATNGVEALKITEEYPIDIVVSDVMMPEMDGIELCDKLKNNLATSHIPVILLTAKSDEESIMTGFRSGAEAYVAKPFDPEMLALRVRNILRARRRFVGQKSRENSVTGESADDIAEELPPLNKFDNEFSSRINTLVSENIDNSEFSISDITRELGISRSLLHIKMKTFFNMSMTDYIKQCRMTRACELLRQGNNVSETAYRTGFSDPNYFTKVFKKTFGMPPTEYLGRRALGVVMTLIAGLSAFAEPSAPSSADGFVTDTVRYTTGERCELIVSRPADAGNLPVVVWFHGGGLVGGEKYIPAELKTGEYVVVAPGYSLLPSVDVDRCIDDAAAAVAWTFRNAEEFGGDPSEIFVAGHSAGGYLTSMIGLDKSWLGKYGIDADSIAALIPFSGQAITHYEWRKMNGIPELQPTIDRYAPLYHVRPDAPAYVIVSGDRDLELFGRYEENAYLWRMLKLVGHPDVSIYELDGHDHGAMVSPGFHILKSTVSRLRHR